VPRIKNPNVDRDEVRRDIKAALRTRNYDEAMDFVLSFYTTVDLIGIRDQLQDRLPPVRHTA
jgi:hypothetical protein